MTGAPVHWIYYSLLNLTFFYVVTSASFIIFYHSFGGTNTALVPVMVSFLGKLMLSAVMVLILKQYWSVEVWPFFVPFALSYLLFTVPEVVTLVKIGDNMAQQKADDDDQS
jgi:hypothetical protein